MTEKDYNPEQKMKKTMQKQEKTKNIAVAKEKSEDKKKEEQKKETKKQPEKPKIKKTEAVVNGKSISMSTKTSAAICRFIKGKGIERAVAELEEVIRKRKVIPMKGEIPHRKGEVMAGRYPKNASMQFIKLLKSLQANANANGLEEPIITEAVANIAFRPFGKFGRIRRKRTHVSIKVKERKK